MRFRVGLIFLFVGVRLLQNFVSTSRSGLTEVWFKSVKPIYSDSECIIRNKEYWVVGKNFCRLEMGSDYLISGRRRSGLIDRLVGRIWLDEPQISQVRKGKVSHLTEWRAYLVEKTESFLPEPESALVLGVVLGYKGSLTNQFYEALIKSGTIHMVVASGYNVMIVILVVLSITLTVFRRRTATFISLVGMVFYIALTGGEVSVLRAGLMGALIVIGTAMGRSTKGWWSLIVAIWLMCLIDPLVVTSVSFQLSVAATFGVIVLAPHLSRRIEERRQRLAGLMERLDLSTTICAILATWPIIWFHFGRGSLVSLVSNTIILPLVPILMGLGSVLIILSITVSPLASIFALPTYAVAHLIVVLVRWFGQ